MVYPVFTIFITLDILVFSTKVARLFKQSLSFTKLFNHFRELEHIGQFISHVLYLNIKYILNEQLIIIFSNAIQCVFD